MRFDLGDLRLFLLVVEAGSITHGAARANLALASASERLRGMEDVGGVRLLERRRRGVRPTAAGEALAHHARIVLRQIDQMKDELDGYAKGAKGNIRLLANTGAIAEHLPAALAPYLAARPNINVDVSERLSTEIVKAVQGGLAEIGIISDAIDPEELQLLPFAVGRLVVVMASDHPLAGSRKLAFSEILQHEFVGLTAESPMQEHIDHYAAKAGHRLKFRARVRTFEGICQMARHGVGIGIIPETAARRCRAMGVRSVRLADDWATRRLSLCISKIDELSPLARDLAEYLSAAAQTSKPASGRP